VEREEKIWAESQREGKEHQEAGLKGFVSINYAGNEGLKADYLLESLDPFTVDRDNCILIQILP
jgi:hypothetical protein